MAESETAPQDIFVHHDGFSLTFAAASRTLKLLPLQWPTHERDAIISVATPAAAIGPRASACRVRHYSPRTEDCYADWIKRFILFHGKRHPLEMGAAEINAFLTDLAVNGRVSASTQNQAFSALLFLYQKVLGADPGRIEGVIRANRPSAFRWF